MFSFTVLTNKRGRTEETVTSSSLPSLCSSSEANSEILVRKKACLSSTTLISAVCIKSIRIGTYPDTKTTESHFLISLLISWLVFFQLEHSFLPPSVVCFSPFKSVSVALSAAEMSEHVMWCFREFLKGWFNSSGICIPRTESTSAAKPVCESNPDINIY